jgi:hypothetical protein
MGSLIFRCPECQRVIEAGVETDEATLGSLRPYKIGLRCSHCGSQHHLEMGEGHLFQMKPRRSSVHYPGLLPDEIDVGGIKQSALSAARQVARS